jgi:hypothetical protein
MVRQEAKKGLAERWLDAAERNHLAFASRPRLERIERLSALAISVCAALFGLGALKAMLKGAGLVPAPLSASLSAVLIPVSGALALLLVVGLFGLLVGVDRADGRDGKH